MRNIYLSNEEPTAALKKWQSAFKIHHNTEEIPGWEGLGRVTAQPVFARQCAPNFKASAMDGIAVVAASTFGASETQPMTLTEGTDFIYVDTGDLIDGDWNAVIMIEETQTLPTGQLEIREAVPPWKSVRAMGEDMVVGEMVVPAGKRLSPQEIGALLAGGVTALVVYKRPKIGILPTGTEIISPWEPGRRGSIIDSNSFLFWGLCTEQGADPHRYDPVPDDRELLKQAVIKAVAENDLVIINAGSSAGSEDYTRSLIEELGTLTTHGVAIKPGKPTVLGVIEGKPVIGTPGYAVAAYVVFQQFVKPVIAQLCGRHPQSAVVTQGVLSKRLVSSLKHLELVPVKLGLVDGKKIATPLNRGAGITMSLVKADGFLQIPLTSEGQDGGDQLPITLIDPYLSVENTLVVTGSHDLLLDLASNQMQQTSPHQLSSSHVGSQGGLMALKRGECHMAPIHLLDEATGSYNLPIVQSYFPGEPMALVKGVGRTQGFMVAKGNPKGIHRLSDLTRPELSYINRQRGSGTRVLLDYLLKEEGLSPQEIKGYDREGITHTAVAAEVVSGGADVGLGVLSAALALGLDFIPLAEEDYDFLLHQSLLDSPMVQSFVATLKGHDFQQELERLGGYTTNRTGEILLVN